MRQERRPKWTVTVRNLKREPIVRAKVTVTIEGHPQTEHELPQIAAGSTQDLEMTFDTT